MSFLKPNIFLALLILPLITSFAFAGNGPNGNYKNNEEFKGYYLTPTPDHLEAMSRWQLDYVKVVKSGDSIRVSYFLPALLVGKSSQKIVMNGKINSKRTFFKLRGKYGVASCRMSKSKGYVCITKFRGLNLNKGSIESNFNELKVSKKVKSSRMLVAKLFKLDPIGVIVIKGN